MKNQLTLLFLFSISIGISQSFNQESIKDSDSNLIGKFNKEALLQEPYATWFEKNYNEYEPETEIISQLKTELSQYTITLFMGTWCGDSKREVPRFYKILEEANFPLERLTAIAVSRERDIYKQSNGGEEEGLNIHRVPTFIIYKNGIEINRITESPVTTLEEDVLKIIQSNYKPNYDGVTYVNGLLEEMGVEKFKRKQKTILKKVKDKIVKFSELNTYSSVLFYASKTEEGIAIAKLNTILYPLEPYGYLNLGNKYFHLKNTEKAKSYYEKALSISPKNESAKKALEILKENESK
jgi:thiol-disulfide isomerase/thioredoxin